MAANGHWATMMKWNVKAVWFTSVCLALSVADTPEAMAQMVDRTTTPVRIMSCSAPSPGASAEAVVSDLGTESLREMPGAALRQRNGAALNTFQQEAAPALAPGCIAVGAGVWAAREVVMRVPVDVCAPTETVIARDLAIVETRVNWPSIPAGWIVASDRLRLGNVIAVAGTRLLVNLSGAGSERVDRAASAEALTALVRSGEVEVAGRRTSDGQAETGPELLSSPLARSTEVDAAAAEPHFKDEPAEFVFVGADACRPIGH